MAILSIERLDNLIHRAPLLIVAGFAIGALARYTDFGLPIAIHLVALGAGLACVQSYKSERGIWMLALLFGASFLAIALVCEFGMLRDAIRDARQPHWTITLDFALTMQIQWLLVRSFIAVVVYNRRLTA
jgi:hypothetical protein